MSYDAPFAGLKVVDLSQGIAGPYSAMLLAQYGADVVKVEPPEGDWARALGKRYGDMTAFAIAANLGKRAIVLDLKAAEGRETLRRLVATADVFLESFRPGVAARLGFGYPDVSALNPRIIYLSVSGFGQTGPDAERPAVDTVFQAFTGIMSVNRGLDDIPHRVPVIVMDMATALSNFQAMAVALYARRDEPRGRYIESSLLRGGATIQAVSMIQHHLEGGKPQPGLTPSGTFKASDGWINLTILRNAEFPALCDALEIPAAKSDPRFATNDSRFANVTALNAALEPAFAGRTCADLSARLRAARLMHQRVSTYLEFLDDPQVKATGAVAWIEQPGIGRVPVPQVPGLPPFRSGAPLAVAPSLDQHRKEILAELERGRVMETPLACFADRPLLRDGPITQRFRAAGVADFADAAGFLWRLPYGRIADRTKFWLVLEEGRGTCTTKHALLAELAREQGIDVDLELGIYEMSERNTPGVGAVLGKYGLECIPEAHCFLRYRGTLVDITGVPAGAEPIGRFLHEEPITIEQIGAYKIERHRRFLGEWLVGQAGAGALGLDEAWRIREECIAALSAAAG